MFNIDSPHDRWIRHEPSYQPSREQDLDAIQADHLRFVVAINGQELEADCLSDLLTQAYDLDLTASILPLIDSVAKTMPIAYRTRQGVLACLSDSFNSLSANSQAMLNNRLDSLVDAVGSIHLFDDCFGYAFDLLDPDDLADFADSLD